MYKEKKTYGREKNGFTGIFPRSTDTSYYSGRHFINKGAYLKYKRKIGLANQTGKFSCIISVEDSEEDMEDFNAFNK